MNERDMERAMKRAVRGSLAYQVTRALAIIVLIAAIVVLLNLPVFFQ